MLSPYGKFEWLTIIIVGTLLTTALIYFHWYIPATIVAIFAIALVLFFRDPHREIPTQRGQMVSPADGHISSVHDLDHYEPFDGPAKCIRIFLSVLDVHVNRSPCHGKVVDVIHQSGLKLNALNPESADKNEAVTIVLHHPTRNIPIAASRQLVGMIARRIVCGVTKGDVLQRGQRYGLIKFGSTTELYLPNPDRVDVKVTHGQKVYGGLTILAIVPPVETTDEEPQVHVHSQSSVKQSQSATTA